MIDNFYKTIDSFYKNTGNITDNNPSYFTASIIIIILIIIILSMSMQTEFKRVNKQWHIYKCHPKYVFIGGLIHKHPEMDRMTYTAHNIGECIGKTLSEPLSDAYKKMNNIRDVDSSRILNIDSMISSIIETSTSVANYANKITNTLYNVYGNLSDVADDNAKTINNLFVNINVYFDQVKTVLSSVKEYYSELLQLIINYHQGKQKKYEKKRRFPWGYKVQSENIVVQNMMHKTLNVRLIHNN